MQELQKDEMDAVNGGVGVLVVVAVAAVVVAVGIGVYNGYKDAALAAHNQK
jgi:lactobin A/cerein 7B family class IIb bacteriocin